MKEILKKFIPSFLLSWYHFLLAFLGAFLYRFPARKMKVIGVTGTNGKSTVVNLTTKILEEAGYKVASLSSIKFKIADIEWSNTLKMTMPGRLKLQRFLRQALNRNCQYVILEVTSEGIKQHRHSFIDFDIAVFTNLTPEHIEAHGSFENYQKAKGKLFLATKGIHIINLDDKNADYFLKFPSEKKYGYNLKIFNRFSISNLQTISAKNIQELGNGIKFSVGSTEFNLKLLGEFNISNALAAISVGLSQGISSETCKRALEKVEGIPGRMEEVISEPFKVFVDYAFTPNALEKVYQILTTNYKLPTTKLICVLGSCGGGRDKWKRPLLGEIAAEHCDKVIITNEDPYDENPIEIIEQVAKGAKGKAEKILDRKEAIRKSLKSARKGDIIVITGKGCEPWICVAKGKKIPWDDRKVVKEEFAKFRNHP